LPSIGAAIENHSLLGSQLALLLNTSSDSSVQCQQLNA